MLLLTRTETLPCMCALSVVSLRVVRLCGFMILCMVFMSLSPQKRGNMFSPALVCVCVCVSVCDHDN